MAGSICECERALARARRFPTCGLHPRVPCAQRAIFPSRAGRLEIWYQPECASARSAWVRPVGDSRQHTALRIPVVRVTFSVMDDSSPRELGGSFKLIRIYFPPRAGRSTFFGTDRWTIHKGSCGYGYIPKEAITGWDVAAVCEKNKASGSRWSLVGELSETSGRNLIQR